MNKDAYGLRLRRFPYLCVFLRRNLEEIVFFFLTIFEKENLDLYYKLQPLRNVQSLALERSERSYISRGRLTGYGSQLIKMMDGHGKIKIML